MVKKHLLEKDETKEASKRGKTLKDKETGLNKSKAS